MIIPKEMREDFDWCETCEFLGDGKYILRLCWENGHLRWKREYQNDLKHGEDITWWSNGNKRCEVYYRNGRLHGKYIVYNKNEIKHIDKEYKDGILIRSHPRRS